MGLLCSHYGQLSHPRHIAEQVIETKFFQQPNTFSKADPPPPAGCRVSLNESTLRQKSPNHVDFNRCPKPGILNIILISVEYIMKLSEVNHFDKLHERHQKTLQKIADPIPRNEHKKADLKQYPLLFPLHDRRLLNLQILNNRTLFTIQDVTPGPTPGPIPLD